MSQLLRIGPVPGDITELEAYIRIFRAAEKLQAVIMDALCNPETGECAVSYDMPSQDMLMFEEKVVAVLGSMLASVSRARVDVLSGRSSAAGSFQIDDMSAVDDILPPLAIFRGEMKRCCESLQVALSKYLPPLDDCSREIWKWLHRLQNVCYDAGFPRPDEYPCPAIFANWSPVYYSTKADEMLKDYEVAFWQGGQVTLEGLAWLLKNKFKTIVDLRDERAMDEHSQAAVNEAILSGKVEVVNLPVDIGTAPSMEQVEQFALLVMDSTRRPVYLHSKEGVGRTSAMVSRWRQFTMLPLSHSTSNAMPSKNGRPAKNASHDESKNVHSAVSLETKSRTSLEDNDSSYLSRKMAAENHNEAFESLHSPSAGVGVHKGRATHEIASLLDDQLNSEVEDTGLESPLELNMEPYPLKAQVPPCNIFSKKEMMTFYKSRKLSPQTYISNCRGKLEVLSSFDGSAILPVQRNDTLPNSQLEEQHSRSLNRRPAVRNVLGTDATNTTNGTATVAGEETVTRESGDYVDPEIETLALVEENMCASETGVVRVQSRKKAEMFLVRTDGFSCTREKVTEAAMTFTHPSTQQQMLMWKSPPKTVLLLKKLGHALMEEAKEIASFLHYQEKMNVLVEPDVHDVFARIPGFGFVQTFYLQDSSDLHDRVDFVTCLGGDGVILHASNIFRGPVPPVVSFNLGSLGFLTSHEFSEYKKDLTAVIHGNNTLGVYITLRMRLRCEIFRKGKAVPGKVFDVLNEVIVDRGSNPYLSKIECYEHNRLITKVQGDGVIIATPTGSTAYSTAAGGSMVHPNVPCMLFTPICPHSLSFRPVILPDSARLELKIPEDARNNAWVSFDGKRRQQLTRGDSVHISMSQHPLPTVNKADQTGDWFRSLIRCLNWNERLEQKAL